MKERVSLNIRLFLVTMCIAVPVIAALFFTGIRERSSAKKERINEIQADVEVEMSKIDTQLKFLRNSLANLVMDDSELKSIADADEEDTDFWLANQDVLEKINNQTAELDSGFTVFVYYPKNGVFYNYKKDSLVSEFVQQQNADKTEEARILQEKYLFCDKNGQVMVPFGDKDTWLSFGGNMYTDELKNSWYYAGAISELSDFYLVKQISKKTLEKQLPAIESEIAVFAAVILLLFVVYGVCLYLWILTPMAYLKKSMGVIQQGNLNYRIQELNNCSAEFDAVIQEFNYLMDHIKNLKIQMYEERLAGKETELQYLSRQIQPHFILNTLNTIYNYSESDVKTTKQLIRLTSGYYRYVVNVNSRYVQLGQELEHIQDYMRLQKMRYPNAFDYKVTCEEAIKIVPIPPFIIESFVGNAIKHGLKPGKMTEIQVNVSKLEEFRILIQVKDNGTGFSDDSLDAVEEFLEKGIVSEELGVGICNSVARLRLIYGDKCEIRIYNQELSGAVVDITLNLQKTEAV